MRTATIVLLLGGCLTGPAEVTYVQSNSLPSNTATRSAPSDLRSVWQGSYTCAQGSTALRFTANRTCGRGEAEQPRVSCSIGGIFEFGPLASNPNVPHGSYRVSGTMVEDADGQLIFDVIPVAWIERPSGYEMVGFHGATDATHRVMYGTIANVSCGSLSLTRD